MSEFKPTYKHLWMVEDTEIPDVDTGRNKSFWTKIGVAFQNRDGSWSLELSAIPVNGRLQMRDPKPREVVDTNERGGRAQVAA